jgi:hypothetical protein
MKVYFAASFSGKKIYENNYRTIVSELQKLGHQVIHEYLFERSKEDFDKQTDEEKRVRQRNLLEWKRDSDVVIVEASTPSFGLGQEIEDAIRFKKPVLALHIPESQPHILTAGAEDLIFISSYTISSLNKVLKENLEMLNFGEMRRFTMLFPADITEHLDSLIMKGKGSRSEYIRKLIRADMKRKS